MELRRNVRSGVVLLELMASILIFALAGAICVQVLVKADTVSTQARLLSDGVRQASSAAEILRSAASEEEALALLKDCWPQTELGDPVRIPLDTGTLHITRQWDGDLCRYQILWRVAEEDLYSLELVRFYPEVSP